MTFNYRGQLFESRDFDFDFCRSFLICAMIVTHVFEMFYQPDYNRNLTYFVTSGFVFLSGFTIGAIYLKRIEFNPKGSFLKLSYRAIKILSIFIITNVGVFIIYPIKLNLLNQLEPLNIIEAILLGTHGEIFGFDILIPIGWTSFLGWFLLRFYNKSIGLISLILFIALIPLVEICDVFNFYALKLVLIGMAGCAIGAWASEIEWDLTISWLTQSTTLVLVFFLIAAYYSILIFNTTKGEIVTTYQHILPTLIIPLYVYIISRRFRLNYYPLFKKINLSLSNNILFIYLFHIFLINALFLLIQKDSLDFFSTLSLSVVFIIFNILVSLAIDFVKFKFDFFSNVYSYIFKL